MLNMQNVSPAVKWWRLYFESDVDISISCNQINTFDAKDEACLTVDVQHCMLCNHQDGEEKTIKQCDYFMNLILANMSKPFLNKNTVYNFPCSFQTQIHILTFACPLILCHMEAKEASSFVTVKPSTSKDNNKKKFNPKYCDLPKTKEGYFIVPLSPTPQSQSPANAISSSADTIFPTTTSVSVGNFRCRPKWIVNLVGVWLTMVLALQVFKVMTNSCNIFYLAAFLLMVSSGCVDVLNFFLLWQTM